MKNIRKLKVASRQNSLTWSIRYEPCFEKFRVKIYKVSLPGYGVAYSTDGQEIHHENYTLLFDFNDKCFNKVEKALIQKIEELNENR